MTTQGWFKFIQKQSGCKRAAVHRKTKRLKNWGMFCYEIGLTDRRCLDKHVGRSPSGRDRFAESIENQGKHESPRQRESGAKSIAGRLCAERVGSPLR